MKRSFLAAAMALLLFACNTEKKEAEVAKNSDWYAQHLKGDVQTVEETSYTPDSTGVVGAMDSCCISTETYDDKGYTTITSKKDSKGAVTEEMSMSRYDKGQAKEMSMKKDGKHNSGFKIQLDSAGKYAAAQELDSAGNVKFFYTNLEEDENGGVTTGKRFKADSSLDGTFYNVYTDGLQTGNSYTDSVGKEVYKSVSELNDKGLIAKTTETEVGKDSTKTTVKTFTYDNFDEAGNWTQRTTYNDEGKATKVVKRSLNYFKKD
jgi:hypothetical protein